MTSTPTRDQVDQARALVVRELYRLTVVRNGCTATIYFVGHSLTAEALTQAYASVCGAIADAGQVAIVTTALASALIALLDVRDSAGVSVRALGAVFELNHLNVLTA